MEFRIVACFFLLISFFPADITAAAVAKSGEGPSIVNIRAGNHKNYIRFVFETPENQAEKASVILSGSNDIKIEFQSPIMFRLSGAKEPLVARKKIIINENSQIVPGESNCVITVNKLDDIKVSKLQSPYRLIVDAFINESAPENVTEKKADNATKKTDTAPKKPDNSSQSQAPLVKTGKSVANHEAAPTPGTLIIDVGHGGQDSGIRAGNFSEKDISLGVAKELGSALSKGGQKVFYTRQSDHGLSISQRIKVVRRISPEVLLSIHMSAKDEFILYTPIRKTPAAGEAANLQMIKSSGREAALIKTLTQKLKDEFKLNVRNEKLPLPLLNAMNIPAVLIEFPGPEKFKYDRNSKKKLAELISGAIISTTAPSAAPANPQKGHGPDNEK